MDLIEALKRDHVHAENIAKALEWLRKELDAAKIPFALVGGLALRYYGYSRFTEDIDILTTKEGLDRIHREIVGRGLVPRFAGARKGMRETEHRVSVDFVTTGEHAGSAESPVVFSDPTSEAFVFKDTLRIPKLETIITYKLASGIWGKRDRDFGDVGELIRANRLTKRFARKLPPALRAEYLKRLERAREQESLE